MARKTYKEVITGHKNITVGKKLNPIPAARREGGNIVIHLDIEEYKRGVQEL